VEVALVERVRITRREPEPHERRSAYWPGRVHDHTPTGELMFTLLELQGTGTRQR
jgi:hypothetical protein